jgi:hypothetical protein
VHGQDVTCVTGKAPISWGKVALVVGIAIIVIGVVGFLIAASR